MRTIFNKYLYKTLLLLFASFHLIACSDDDNNEVVNIDPNPLNLEVSNNYIVLDLDNPDKEIVSFTWEPAQDRTSEGIIIEGYLFKMDLANKSFETSIPSTSIKNGLFYKTFTTRELNDLFVTQWGLVLGDEVGLEARVIATYSNPDKFVKPAVSTIPFKIQSIAPESRPLYLTGSATTAGTSIENSIEMTEILKGETYTWRGKLKVGEYFFITQRNNQYPAYVMNELEEADKIIYKQSDSEPGKPFTIAKEGVYAISVNLTTRRITCEEVFYIEILSAIGSGTNWGWPSGTAPADDPKYGGVLSWSLTNPHECEITTELKTGELRICMAGQTDAAFRPYNAAAPITQVEHDVVFMSKPDYKWKIEAADAGTYRIILDTKNFKIRFIKQ